MKKKYILIVLIIFVAVIGLSVAYATTENDSPNKTAFSIKSDKPVSVSEMANMIKTQPFFKNYNATTLNWLNEFDQSYVIFETNDYYIIMNSTDSNKIIKGATTGISVSSNITGSVLENKSLGKGLNNILHVDDIELISNDVNNFDFGRLN